MSKKHNNADSTLAWDLLASWTNFVLKTWEGALFPPTWDAPYKVTHEHYEWSIVTKREILTISARSTDAFTISARSSQICVQDDSADPKTRTQNALSFSSWDRVYMTINEDDFNDLVTFKDVTVPATYATKDEVKKWSLLYQSSSTWDDDYEINIPWLTSYVDWATYRFKADVANTWPSSLNATSLWAIALKKNQWTEDLITWDILANGIVTATYNSTWPVFQFVWQEATVVAADSQPFIFWDWSDWDLVIPSGTTNLSLNNQYNYESINISVWAILSTVWTVWALHIKCKWNCNIDGDIDISWIDSENDTWNIFWLNINFWNSWNGWSGWAWALTKWGTWAWQGSWYGWGGGWSWVSTTLTWWNGWVGWTPWGSWGSWGSASPTTWGNGWTSAWGGWAWYSWNNWGAGWSAYWNNWGWAWLWGGWGWAGWKKWPSPVLFLYADSFSWSWIVKCNWGVWGNWWNWGGWAWLWGWGGAWGGWGGWVIVLVWNTNIFSWTLQVNWWTGWTGGTWNVAWWSWSSWSAWNTVNDLIKDVLI